MLDVLTSCLMGVAAANAAAKLNEFSPRTLRRPAARARLARDPHAFHYANPSIDTCYNPLSLEEKLRQQAAALWLANSRQKQRLNKPLTVLAHPSLIPIVPAVRRLQKFVVGLEIAYFGSYGGDNESDAFRHYVGVVLMTREFGEYRTRLMTDAHEKNNITMASLMDRYNNSLAIWEARQWLSAGGNISDEAVIARGLALVRARTLVFLRGDLPENHGHHYSAHGHFVQWAHEFLRQKLK